MKYFERILSDVDVVPFLDEIAAIDDVWRVAMGRQQKIEVQREALAIPLRGVRKSAIGDRKRRDVHESRWTTLSARFAHARRFLNEAAERHDATLGRAKVVCLPAGGRVYPHNDKGLYYRAHQRYHLVLRSTEGSWLKAADEEVRMRPGELWWFDNDQTHEARNDGDEDRIHLIFDLMHRANAARLYGAAA